MIELARDGLLEIAPNRGFFVSPLSAQEIGELYPLIARLEVAALHESVPSRSTLAELDRINARFAAAATPSARQRLDSEWHELLIGECTNRTLRSIIEDLRIRVRRYELAYLRDTRRTPMSAEQHRDIVRLLRKGDVKAAAALLERNWRQGVDLVVPWAKALEGAE
jgi:DNA-binding GntR family transcriptional regulator